MMAGGKFLMGVVQLTIVGVPQFAVRYWWLALILIVASAAAWRWRWPEKWRWLIAAAFLMVWLMVALPNFDRALSPPEANAIVAAFTAVTAAGIVYVYTELSIGGRANDAATRWRLYAARFPFLVLLFAAVLALPYLRGAYATTRNHPTIEFIGKDRA